MSQALISVIVPVYKVEEYLPRCIDSILAQTYKNLEIILVDDGSPDKCPGICDEYAKKDPRIKVIHKKNGGVSSARNAGLKAAIGDYIFFVDSDDIIAKDALRYLYSRAQKTNAELVVGGIVQSYPSGDVVEEGKDVEFKNPQEALYDLIGGGIFSGCYAKLFEAKLAKSKKFDLEYTIAEDYFYLFELMRDMKGKTIKAITPNIYKRIVREDGAIKNKVYFVGLHDSFKVNERIIRELRNSSSRLREAAFYRYRQDALNICLAYVRGGSFGNDEKEYLRAKVKKYRKELKNIKGFSVRERIIWKMMSHGMWRTLYVLQKIHA